MNELNFGEKPVVSIIVPVYENQECLERCLKSIAEQTFSAFEAIVVDAGSTDSSSDIIDEWSARDSRFKKYLLGRANAGVARNYGMGKAQGQYFAFLDADDMFDCDFLTRMLSLIESEESDIALCAMSTIGDTDEDFTRLSCDEWEMPASRPFCPAESACDTVFNATNPSPSNKLFKASFVKEHNLFFHDLSSCNDVLFTFSALASAQSISVDDTPLVFVDHESRRTLAEPFEFQLVNPLRALSSLREWLIANNLYETYQRSFDNFALGYVLAMSSTYDESSARQFEQLARRLLCEEWGFTEKSDDYFYSSHQSQMMNGICADYISNPSASATVVVSVLRGADIDELSLCLDSVLTQTYGACDVLVVPEEYSRVSDLNAIAEDVTSRGIPCRVLDTGKEMSYGEIMYSACESLESDFCVVVNSSDFLSVDFVAEHIMAMQHDNHDVSLPQCQVFSHDSHGFLSPRSLVSFNVHSDCYCVQDDSQDKAVSPLLYGMVVRVDFLKSAHNCFQNMGSNVEAANTAFALLLHSVAQSVVDVKRGSYFIRDFRKPLVKSTSTAAFNELSKKLSDIQADSEWHTWCSRFWCHTLLEQAESVELGRLSQYWSDAASELQKAFDDGTLPDSAIFASDLTACKSLVNNWAKWTHGYNRRTKCSVSFVLDARHDVSAAARTLDSLLVQSLEDIEFFCLVEEKCSRESQLLLRANADGRVKFLSVVDGQDFLGSVLEHSCGDYLCFLNSGDVASDNFFERVYRVAAKAGVDVCLFDYELVDSAQHTAAFESYLSHRELLPSGVAFLRDNAGSSVLNVAFTHMYDKVFKTSFVRGLNLSGFDKEQVCADFAAVALLRAGRIAVYGGSGYQHKVSRWCLSQNFKDLPAHLLSVRETLEVSGYADSHAARFNSYALELFTALSSFGALWFDSGKITAQIADVLIRDGEDGTVLFDNELHVQEFSRFDTPFHSALKRD